MLPHNFCTSVLSLALLVSAVGCSTGQNNIFEKMLVENRAEKIFLEDQASLKQAAITKEEISSSEDITKTEVSAPKVESQTTTNKESKIGFILTSILQSNMHPIGDDQNSTNLTIQPIVTYKINEQYSMTGILGGSKDLTGLRESQLSFALASVRRRDLYDISGFKGDLDLSLVVPLSENAIKNETERGQFILGHIIHIPTIKSISLSVTPRIGVHVNKFKQSNSGTVNTQYSLSNILSASYEFNDKWSLSIWNLVNQNINYAGTKAAPSFLNSLELGYTLNKKTSLALGLGNSGSLINNQLGKDQSFRIYDENSSTVYTSMNYKF